MIFFKEKDILKTKKNLVQNYPGETLIRSKAKLQEGPLKTLIIKEFL